MLTFARRFQVVWLFAALAACRATHNTTSSTNAGSGTGGRDSSSSTTTSAAAGGGGAGGGSLETHPYGTDCPNASPTSLPADSPRILIIGPWSSSFPAHIPVLQSPNTAAIAAHLQGLLTADPAFKSAEVVALPLDATSGGVSLMNFFYQPDQRDTRLAPLQEPWTYVVLLENALAAKGYPEFYFEGVRVLGCNARAHGAKPVVLMNWSEDHDAVVRGNITYRVANGTNSIVAPAGFAWDAAEAAGTPVWGQDDSYIAAATLYTTLTSRNADTTSYVPPGIAPSDASSLSTIAHDTVLGEAKKVHYLGPYFGSVEMRTAEPGSALWFMDSGTSSEQIWFDRMNEILPKATFQADGTQIGYTNPYKAFDDADLANAMPYFQKQQYRVLFARDYFIDAATITTQGGQPEMQVQVWDRHADADPSDGITFVSEMESELFGKYAEAESLGLALIPYHLMFSKLKTMRPSVQLLSDGTHATYPAAYGLGTMSVVSRTGSHPPISGLDADAALAAVLGEETIRQLSTLSASGTSVPDDPSARPTAP